MIHDENTYGKCYYLEKKIYLSDNNKHASAQQSVQNCKGLQLRPHYKILNRLITLIAIIAFTLFLRTQNISGKGL
jgi:hypothetical protein